MGSWPKHLASLFGAHAFLALTFALAWLAPETLLAARPGDAGLVMLLEGVTLIACVLVGGYVEVAYTFLPLIGFGVVLWLLAVGRAGLSAGVAGFVWSVGAAFFEGLRAHRGELGFARENIAHPHRRYDRIFLLYFGTLPLVPLLWVVTPARFAVWATVYYALAAASDSFLRAPIDRIPRAILRRMQSKTSPELAAKLGLCRTCHYVQPAVGHPDGKLVRCALSTKDPRFAEFPDTPLTNCAGHKPR
jgi:hypothetical protein